MSLLPWAMILSHRTVWRGALSKQIFSKIQKDRPFRAVTKKSKGWMLNTIRLTSIERSRNSGQCSSQANKTAFSPFKTRRSNHNRSTLPKLTNSRTVQALRKTLNDSLLIEVALNKLKMDKITTRMTFLGNLVQAAELRVVQRH